jgi:hypothetical protein
MQLQKFMGEDYAEPPFDPNDPQLIEIHNHWEKKERKYDDLIRTLKNLVVEIMYDNTTPVYHKSSEDKKPSNK